MVLLKPVIEEEEATSDGELSYVIENGVFKELVERINNAQEFIESDQKQRISLMKTKSCRMRFTYFLLLLRQILMSS